jgi:hypothetical protein
MLRELLARELSWKAAPGFAILAAMVWPFICWLLPAAGPFVLLVLCGVSISDVLFKERVSRFEAALPIAGRQLVATRLVAALAVVWFPTLVAAAETLAFRGWKDASPLLGIAAVSSLAMLAGRSFRMRDMGSSPWLGGAMLACAYVPILVPAVLFWLLSHWGAVLGVCFAGSAAAVARLRGGLPEGFQIAPARAARARRFVVGRPAWCRVRMPVWWPAWRSLSKWRDWMVLGWLPFAFMMGMSWVAGAWLVSPAMQARHRLEWLLVLPVSRRRLLLMVMLPWLGILTGAVLLYGHFRSVTKVPAVSTGYSDVWEERKPAGSGTPNVLVPAGFWRWAWGWNAPVIQSPWGEKTEPKGFHRLGLAFYNPYSVAPDNSARFLEWQVARATEAVCGARGVPVPRRIRTRSIEVLAAALAFLGMFHLVLWGKGKRRVLVWIAWWGAPALFGLDIITTARQVRDSGPLGDVLTLRLAAILPQNPVALLALAALLLGSLYWGIERRFEKADLVQDLKAEDGKR